MINGFGEAGAIEKERAGLEKEFGIKALYSAADMSKPAEIAAMVGERREDLRRARHPGEQCRHPVRRQRSRISRSAKWDAVIAINLSSSFHTIRAAVPGMKKRKWGRIINIASAHGLVASGAEGRLRRGQARAGRPDQGGGDRERQCRHHLQRHLPRLGARRRWSSKQIDDRAKATGQECRAGQDAIGCWRRSSRCTQYTTPEKIGALAVFLSSDGASTITGSAYSIDGGWVAQ